jgi:hypothetical protein
LLERLGRKALYRVPVDGLDFRVFGRHGGLLTRVRPPAHYVFFGVSPFPNVIRAGSVRRERRTSCGGVGTGSETIAMDTVRIAARKLTAASTATNGRFPHSNPSIAIGVGPIDPARRFGLGGQPGS